MVKAVEDIPLKGTDIVVGSDIGGCVKVITLLEAESHEVTGQEAKRAPESDQIEIAVLTRGKGRRQACGEQDTLVLGVLFSPLQQDGGDSGGEAEGREAERSSQD